MLALVVEFAEKNKTKKKKKKVEKTKSKMKEMRQFEPNRNSQTVFISDGTRHRTHYHRRLLISIPRFTEGDIFGWECSWMRQTEWNRWLVCSSPIDYFVLKTIDPCWSISMVTWIVHRNRVRQWRFYDSKTCRIFSRAIKSEFKIGRLKCFGTNVRVFSSWINTVTTQD